ncbi:MAG: SAM-dependent chlorinase/fluorinase [Alphaproteobacteria bacterium]|nr:SAM-dependent chlorinase/fluorinase [Alphaproteobacteria bacterium]
MRSIVLFTDFGLEGPYVGQMKAVLARAAPGTLVFDLFADAPAFDPEASAYLLAAFRKAFAKDTVFLCVVDPGVGDPGRRPAIVRADGQWFVGPDNGLFNVVAKRAAGLDWWDITWAPADLSASFHGRDLFAPVAARLARGEAPPGLQRDPATRVQPGWPDDLPRVVYIDRFGNAMTGIRAAALGEEDTLAVGKYSLARARTFADVPKGSGFWYENANGLVEIAVNCGRADRQYGLAVGTTVSVPGKSIT